MQRVPHIHRYSPAHSGGCCLAGLCSGPAVTSSLCLCCRWCASSLGCLSFCWPGTSLLFQPPANIRKPSAHSCKSTLMATPRVQMTLYISVSFLSHYWKWENPIGEQLTSPQGNTQPHSLASSVFPTKPNTATNTEWEMIDCRGIATNQCVS